jgi:hypothetical protein
VHLKQRPPLRRRENSSRFSHFGLGVVVVAEVVGGSAEVTTIDGRETLGKEPTLGLGRSPPRGGSGHGSVRGWGVGGAPRWVPEQGASKGACASSVRWARTRSGPRGRCPLRPHTTRCRTPCRTSPDAAAVPRRSDPGEGMTEKVTWICRQSTEADRDVGTCG